MSMKKPYAIFIYAPLFYEKKYTCYTVYINFTMEEALKQIVIGRSGYGKTAYITERIKEDLKAGYDNIIVIVPDQFTFETERELIRETGAGLFEIRVLSFRRLISVLRDELGTNGCYLLDEVNKAMFVNKLLYDYDNELKVYKGAYKVPGFSFDMAKTITECKQFGASAQDLQELETRGKTKEKLKDITEIYRAYSEFKDKFKDNEDIINIINDRIKNSQLIKGARIYIDHFDVFTFQGFNTIEEMAKVCSLLCVCLCTDGSKKGLFSLTTQTVEKLREKVPDMEVISLKERENINSITHLEKNLFDGKEEIKDVSDSSVELFSFATALSEVDHAIAKIIELKNSGYLYKDISLMVGDIEEYGRLVEQCMLDCGIPYFLDRKIPLMSRRIAKFLIYSLKNCLTFEQGCFIGMIKQGIMLENKEDIQEIENFVLKHGMRRMMVPIKDNEHMEELRKKVTAAGFKKEMQKAKTAREMARAAVNYLYSFEITFESEVDERSFKKVIEILERMEHIFEDTEMEAGLFTSVLETGLLSVTLGVIPDKRDCVVIGDISRTKIQKAKCLLVLGISDGTVPKITQKTGLLSDYDSAAIEIKIGRDSFDLNNLEQLLTYKMFSKPTDYLYLSHSDRGVYGNERENKMLFPKVQRLLGGLVVNMDVPFNEEMSLRLLRSKSIAFKNLIADVYAGNDNYITKGVYYYFKEQEKDLFKPKIYDLSITENQARDIYGKTAISATRIESYYKCAFMQFVKYGLRPKKRELYKINRLDTGKLLHSIIDEFSRYLIDETRRCQKRGDSMESLYAELQNKVASGGMIEEIVKKRMEEDELSVYSGDNIGKVMAKRITSMGKSALMGVIDELRNSDFVMVCSEQDLRRLGSYKLENMELDGRIDRVDVSGDGIRIVDYKQGGKALDFTSVYAGVKLQLFLYMEAVIEHYKAKENKELLPLELEYYKITPEYKNINEVEKFLKAQPVAGISSLKAGEDKKGAVAREDMSRLMGFGMAMAKRAARRIYEGDIAISPYAIAGSENENGCAYCDFKDICKNGDMSNRRVFKKAELEDIIGENGKVE